MYFIISLLIFLDHHPEIEHNDPTYHPQYTEPLNNAEDPGEQGLYKFLCHFSFWLRVDVVCAPYDATERS